MIQRLLPARYRDELDQFLLLCRGSVSRLLNAALPPRDGDTAQLALWRSRSSPRHPRCMGSASW
jgi:hypothetical protein